MSEDRPRTKCFDTKTLAQMAELHNAEAIKYRERAAEYDDESAECWVYFDSALMHEKEAKRLTSE